MSTTPPSLPLLGIMAGFYRFTVAKYHKLIEIGMLTEDDDLELLEGYLVHKMPRNPPHAWATNELSRRLLSVLPSGWVCRCLSAITLADSEPEPDLAVIKGNTNTSSPNTLVQPRPCLPSK